MSRYDQPIASTAVFRDMLDPPLPGPVTGVEPQMSFQIDLDPYDEAYGHFIEKIQAAIQKTFSDEEF